MGEDQEVADAGFLVRQITEGWVDVMRGAEGCPSAEGVGSRLEGLRDKGIGGEVQRRAEISAEAVLGGNVKRRQGTACG